MEQPLLIVVSGLPGSGKTTLARVIGTRLRVPVVERDRFAEVWFDALGAEAPATADLGAVSYELLFHVAREFMASQRSLVVESNFSRARHAEQLRALVEPSAYGLVEVHCRAPGDVLLQRYAARSRDGTRHRRHDDVNRIEEFRAVFADPGRHEDAVVFPDRALILDTTRDVPIDEVLRYVSQSPPASWTGRPGCGDDGA